MVATTTHDQMKRWDEHTKLAVAARERETIGVVWRPQPEDAPSRFEVVWPRQPKERP